MYGTVSVILSILLLVYLSLCQCLQCNACSAVFLRVCRVGYLVCELCSQVNKRLHPLTSTPQGKLSCAPLLPIKPSRLYQIHYTVVMFCMTCHRGGICTPQNLRKQIVPLLQAFSNRRWYGLAPYRLCGLQCCVLFIGAER